MDTDAPMTLTESGRPPRTRMEDPQRTQDRVQNLLEADSRSRSRLRAMVKGLVDGNAPYRWQDLKAAGRADACNVNWRVAEALLNSAIGAFYDVFSESSTFATVTVSTGDPTMDGDYSRIVTEEFHELLSHDRSWDYTIQTSQYEMVLYGAGPLIFENEYDWRCVSTGYKELLLPDYTKSDTTTWEEAVVMSCYQPHQIYESIANTRSATAMGWNVPAVRRAIINAHQQQKKNDQYHPWEWYQMELKTKSYAYSAESKQIEVSHYFLREFGSGNEPGKITHVIVPSPQNHEAPVEYLYQKINRYDSWEQIIHPMYYDNLGGGPHHAVTGIGVKMYSALQFQNKLLCQLAEQAFAPKLMWKPTTAQADQAFNVVRYGNNAKVPPGYDVVQMPTAGLLEEGLGFERHVSNLLSANLSQYRQNLESKEGNPRTATEIQQRASEQARLGKTQLNRYYNQMDWLYCEKFRRAAKVASNMPGGKKAAEFRKKCMDRGVPRMAFDEKNWEVKASRIVGQGSEYLRQYNLEFLLGMIAMLPEMGRQNLISDVIAARAGQTMVERYFPRPEKQMSPDDQLVTCMNQIGSAKVGVPPVVTDEQNHVLFAGTFLKAASESLASIQQGANPVEVLTFLEALGPAIAKHISYLAGDESRKGIVDAMSKQWKQLAQATEQLRKRIGQQQQQQMEQAQRQNQVMGDQQLKQWESQQEQQRKQQEFQQSQLHRDQKMNQQLAAKDVQLAQEVRANTQRMALERQESEQRTEE